MPFPIKPFESEKEAEDRYVKEKKRVERILKRLLKRTQQREIKYREKINECLRWDKLHHEALLLQSHLFKIKRGLREIEVIDWEKNGERLVICLDPLLEPHEDVALRFKRAKKLRTGLKYAKEFVQEVENQREALLLKLQKLNEIQNESELKEFQEQNDLLPKQKIAPAKIDPKKPPPSFRTFKTQAGLSLWVGKNAKNNDQLTFNFAKGLDWWFHAHQASGSHVILRPEKNQDPDQESIKDAIQLALYYSKARQNGSGEVVITQRKYVSRYGKGKIGRVIVSKHKIVYSLLDLERLKTRLAT